jgi:hypothetical protein
VADTVLSAAVEKFANGDKGPAALERVRPCRKKRGKVATVGNKRGQHIDSVEGTCGVKEDSQDVWRGNFFLVEFLGEIDFAASSLRSAVKILGEFPPKTAMEAGSNDNLP